MLYYQTKSDCKRNQQFRRYSKNSHILLIVIEALAVTLTVKIINQFLFTTLRLMMIHHHTKFGKEMVEWCRRYHPDKIRHMDRQTERQNDSNPPTPPPYLYAGYKNSCTHFKNKSKISGSRHQGSFIWRLCLVLQRFWNTHIRSKSSTTLFFFSLSCVLAIASWQKPSQPQKDYIRAENKLQSIS